MSLTARPTRGRVAALAAGLALSITMVSVPAVVAQDEGPESPIYGLASAMTEKRFDDLPAFFCQDFESEARTLDLRAAMAESMPPGIDVGLVVDALALNIDGLGVTVLDQTEDMATLAIEGTLTMAFDPVGARPLLRLLIGLQTGAEATEDMVDVFMTTPAYDQLEQQFAGRTQDISADSVSVVRSADGVWQICSQLSGTDGASAAAAAGETMAPEATAAADATAPAGDTE